MAISLGAILVAAQHTPAQAADCSYPQTQLDMNTCAYEAWQQADEDLNLAYGMAVDRAKRIDSFDASTPRRAGGPDAEGVPTEEMLRRAQRAWISFRDAACLVESDMAKGGSMQPLLYWSCAEGLTRSRTEQLRFFGELN
ncbi:MAG: lysozyme inhibitor LprI family protein [Pseudomonadota bacterium]